MPETVPAEQPRGGREGGAERLGERDPEVVAVDPEAGLGREPVAAHGRGRGGEVARQDGAGDAALQLRQRPNRAPPRGPPPAPGRRSGPAPGDPRAAAGASPTRRG